MGLRFINVKMPRRKPLPGLALARNFRCKRLFAKQPAKPFGHCNNAGVGKIGIRS